PPRDRYRPRGQRESPRTRPPRNDLQHQSRGARDLPRPALAAAANPVPLPLGARGVPARRAQGYRTVGRWRGDGYPARELAGGGSAVPPRGSADGTWDRDGEELSLFQSPNAIPRFRAVMITPESSGTGRILPSTSKSGTRSTVGGWYATMV